MAKKIAVIGLGHFGAHLAVTLAEKGVEVLAIDQDMDALDDIKDKVTHCVRLDATEARALKGQGLEDYDAVVVGIRNDFEATLLSVGILQQMNAKRIIVRAITPVHERILNHLGVTEVVLPAVEAAERLCNSLMYERVVGSFEVSSEYTIMEVQTADAFIGITVQELDLRRRFDVNLITIKRSETVKRMLGLGTHTVERILGTPKPTTVIERGDTLVVFGKKKAIEQMLSA